MSFSQEELDYEQPNDQPFAVILDDGENLTLSFFHTLSEAEEYQSTSPVESHVYCGRSVDYHLYG